MIEQAKLIVNKDLTTKEQLADVELIKQKRKQAMKLLAREYQLKKLYDDYIQNNFIEMDRRILLYFALITKKHDLFPSLLTWYSHTETPLITKEAFKNRMNELLRAIGVQSSIILTSVSQGPNGCEDLLLTILNVITSEEQPTDRTVTIVKQLYKKFNNNARYLIPIMPTMSRYEILQSLNRFICLDNIDVETALRYLLYPAADDNEIGKTSLESADQDVNKEQQEEEKEQQGQQQQEEEEQAQDDQITTKNEKLSAIEVLIELHFITCPNDYQLDHFITKQMKAIDFCLSDTLFTNNEILIQLLEKMLCYQYQLPLLYMRTLMQIISIISINYQNYIIQLLHRLIDKKLWLYPNKQLWNGFVNILFNLLPDTLPIIFSLPKEAFNLIYLQLLDKISKTKKNEAANILVQLKQQYLQLTNDMIVKV